MPPSPPRRATSGDPPSPTVSVVIPALNEEHNLPLVLEGLPPVHEVIVVDGGSTDDTIAVAREVRPDAVIVRQTRHGKGNALACGFAVSQGDIVVTLNADGSTDPGELPRFVDALLSGAEVAHGSRFREGGGQLDGRRLDRLGNRMFSQVVNLFFGTRFTDLGYGYNAYWRTLLPTLDLPSPDMSGLRRNERLWGDGPEIEPLINIRMAAKGLRVVEVASVGYPPIHGDADRHSLRGAQRAMRAATAEYIRRWRIGDAPADPSERLALPPATVARSTGARTGGARPGGVPSALARSQRRWQTETRSADPRPTSVPPAETRSAAPRSAETRSAEIRPAAPPREPGARSWADTPPQSRDTPPVPHRQRRADQAARLKPAAETWVEGEESMGRHSADESGRRATSAGPDRRRGYPEPGYGYAELPPGGTDPTSGYLEPIDPTIGYLEPIDPTTGYLEPTDPGRGYPEQTRGGARPTHRGPDPIRGGAAPRRGYPEPALGGAADHLATGIRRSYPEPARGQIGSGEYPGTGTRHSYAEPTWSQKPARDYAAPETGTWHSYAEPPVRESGPPPGYPDPSGRGASPSAAYPKPSTRGGSLPSYPDPAGRGGSPSAAYPKPNGRGGSLPNYPDPASPSAAYPKPSRQGGSPSTSYSDLTARSGSIPLSYPDANTRGASPSTGYPEPNGRGVNPSTGYPEPSRRGGNPATSYPDLTAPSGSIPLSYPEPGARSASPAMGYPEPSTRGASPAMGYPEPSTRGGNPATSYPEPNGRSGSIPLPNTRGASPPTGYPEPNGRGVNPSTGYPEPSRRGGNPSTSYPDLTTPSGRIPLSYPDPNTRNGNPPAGYPEPNGRSGNPATSYPDLTAPSGSIPLSYPEPGARSGSVPPGYPEPASRAAGGRRARAEPARSRAAEEQVPDRGVPRKRRRYPETAAPADGYAEPSGAVADGRRARPEPDRGHRDTERRPTYRAPGQDDGGRSWHIPDEPWRGTEVPWRGPDGEYHTGQFEAITDDDQAEAPGSRRPDLTVIEGGVAPDVREYDSNYAGRDVPPLVAEPHPPRREGPPPGRADQIRLPQQPHSRHLRSLPGQNYGRMENG